MATPAHPYGKHRSATITTRLTHEQREQVLLCAEAHGVSPGELTRVALTRLTAGKDPAGVADDLRAALGLSPEATPDEIAAAVSDVLDEIMALDGQPAEENPDPMAAAGATPPADPNKPNEKPVAASKLSEAQVAALQKRGLPATTEAWAALGKSVLRSAKDAPAPTASTGHVALSRAEVARQVAALKPEVRKAALAKGMTPEQFVIARAGVLRKAQ
jgi:hypothetical protein